MRKKPNIQEKNIKQITTAHPETSTLRICNGVRMRSDGLLAKDSKDADEVTFRGRTQGHEFKALNIHVLNQSQGTGPLLSDRNFHRDHRVVAGGVVGDEGAAFSTL
ncbi:hypothetical protein HON52_03275 [Candidatus Uhrbacteria bacterium]|nr:hypothetical protein [Candidatus Uhrbacteria bacterium]